MSKEKAASLTHAIHAIGEATNLGFANQAVVQGMSEEDTRAALGSVSAAQQGWADQQRGYAEELRNTVNNTGN